MNLDPIALIFSILPSVLSGMVLFYCQKRDKKRDAREAEKDAAQEKYTRQVLKGLHSSLTLGEATAIAVKTGHANGELDRALAEAQAAKSSLHEFLTDMSASHLND